MVSPDIRTFAPGMLASAAANQFAVHISDVIAERGRCRFGLSGGRTPRAVYEHMAMLPIAWSDVQLFWSDDRCVPQQHDQSNYGMALAALISRVDIPDANVHRIEGERSPGVAASRYAELLEYEPIDVLLLGMGSDGHTASLFPGADLGSTARVVATKSPVPPYDRVSLTIRAINECGAVYLIVAGNEKAHRLAEVASQIEGGNPTSPTAFVQPASRRLTWIVDRPAGSRLKGHLHG